MSTTTDRPPPRGKPPPRGRSVRRLGDRLFAGASRGAGIAILVVLAAVALFLLREAFPALTAPAQDIPGEHGIAGYVGPLLFGSLLGALLALLIAAPLSVGIAVFISHYAPRRLAQVLGYMVDLLAAVPSIIYGLWGFNTLAPATVPLTRWLESNLGFVPLFAGPASVTGRTMFTVGIVLAVMILPIMTAIVREVFLQTPPMHEQASLALGATRWEMIRMTVLPFGRSGIISGAMLGLGRALGETMAVAIVLSPSGAVTLNLIGSGNPSTIAADIALEFPEATGIEVNTLIAAGLALFVVTLAVNMAARWVISRRAQFSGAN